MNTALRGQSLHDLFSPKSCVVLVVTPTSTVPPGAQVRPRKRARHLAPVNVRLTGLQVNRATYRKLVAWKASITVGHTQEHTTLVGLNLQTTCVPPPNLPIPLVKGTLQWLMQGRKPFRRARLDMSLTGHYRQAAFRIAALQQVLVIHLPRSIPQNIGPWPFVPSTDPSTWPTQVPILLPALER